MKKLICAFAASAMIFSSAIVPSDRITNSLVVVSAEAASVKNSAPTGLKAAVTGTSVKLMWNNVSGAESYRVYIYDSNDKKYKKYCDVCETSCVIDRLKSGKTYYFKVAAIRNNTVGKKSGNVKAKIIKPVSLYDLRWDTDYYSFTNAKAYKVESGDAKADLDGDGIEEIINFTHDDESENGKDLIGYQYWGTLPVIPYINGKSVQVSTDIENDYSIYGKCISFDSGYESQKYRYFYICDIDSNDKYKEIAMIPFEQNDDYCTAFYRYIDGELKYIGCIRYDSPNACLESNEKSYRIGDMNITWGRPMIIDGSGIITAAVRLKTQTWFGYTQYEYNPKKGRIDQLANKEVYPYGYEERNSYAKAWKRVRRNWYNSDESDCLLTRDITVYKTPSKKSEGYIIKSQPAIPTGEYEYSSGKYCPGYSDYVDYREEYKNTWVYVAAKDGTCGWYYVGSYDNLSDLFTVTTNYD